MCCINSNSPSSQREWVEENVNWRRHNSPQTSNVFPSMLAIGAVSTGSNPAFMEGSVRFEGGEAIVWAGNIH